MMIWDPREPFLHIIYGLYLMQGENEMIRERVSWIFLSSVMLFIFLIPLANGSRIYWNGIFHTYLLVPFIYFLRFNASEPIGKIQPIFWVFLLSFIMVIIAAFVSALVNGHTSTLIWFSFFSGYLGPLFVLIVLYGLHLSNTQMKYIWAVFAIGALYTFGTALSIYYEVWGIPSGLELLLSRYQLIKMAPYLKATFGNTSSTAAILVMLIMPFTILATTKNIGRWRILFGITAIVLFLNLVIVQSRAAILITILGYFAALIFLKKEGRTLALMGVLATTTFIALAWKAIGFFISRFTTILAADRAADNSVDERVRSIEIGWQIFKDYFEFGVGPNNSHTYNIFFNAHQSWIERGSELGLIGFIGYIIFSLSVVLYFVTFTFKGMKTEYDYYKFVFLIGPSSYLLYGIIGNMPIDTGLTNVWIIMCVTLLALSFFREKRENYE